MPLPTPVPAVSAGAVVVPGVAVAVVTFSENWSSPYLRRSSKSSSGGLDALMLWHCIGGGIEGATRLVTAATVAMCLGAKYGYNGLLMLLLACWLITLLLTPAGNVLDLDLWLLLLVTPKLLPSDGSGRAFWLSGSKSSRSKLVLLLSSSDIRSFMLSSWCGCCWCSVLLLLRGDCIHRE